MLRTPIKERKRIVHHSLHRLKEINEVYHYIKGEKTIAQVSAQYKVHPNQVLKWKKHLQENVAGIFPRKKDPRIAEQEELIEQLYKKIGQEEIELEFLKKSTNKL